jgi:hypothetical protein
MIRETATSLIAAGCSAVLLIAFSIYLTGYFLLCMQTDESLNALPPSKPIRVRLYSSKFLESIYRPAGDIEALALGWDVLILSNEVSR